VIEDALNLDDGLVTCLDRFAGAWNRHDLDAPATPGDEEGES
jgi:hypothetical protein